MKSSERAGGKAPKVVKKAVGAVKNWVRRGVNRIRSRGRPAFFRAMRMTGATVAAYVVALALLPARSR